MRSFYIRQEPVLLHCGVTLVVLRSAPAGEMGLVADNRQQGELLLDGRDMKLILSLPHLPKHRSSINKIKYPLCGAVCVHGSKSGCLLVAVTVLQ